MPNDHPHPPERNLADQVARRRDVAGAGHTGDVVTARRGLTDENGMVRATALRALARLGMLTPTEIAAAAADPEVVVRRGAAAILAAADDAYDDLDDPLDGGRDDGRGAAAILAGAYGRGDGRGDGRDGALGDVIDSALASLLADADDTVIEVAAWAAGERLGRANEAGERPSEPALIDMLIHLAIDHDDALCREAAVAALGAAGDERGLPAILAATHDKATVRRRAVIALAPFAGPAVDEALARAQSDRDWQVRQAAEDQLEIMRDLPS